MKALILILSIFYSFKSFSNLVEEGYFINDPKREFIKIVTQHPDLTIDHVNQFGFEIYGPKGLGLWLNGWDLSYNLLDEFNEVERNRLLHLAQDYPKPEEIGVTLQNLEKKYPEILKLESIGNSEKGRPLWLMKISDNVNRDETEPEVKFIGNMHGDEIVGREVLVRLIEDLASSYNKNSKIKDLINNSEIFIIPSLNPDGALNIRRGNNSYVDLNRDFPDFTTGDNRNDPSGRAIETKAMMEFQKRRNFSLSANFHGGALVVNYPWDTDKKKFPFYNLIKQFSLEYATLNIDMKNSTRFPQGITNGYDWYEVNGGMQDWSYYWHGDLQVTVEISNVKYPNYNLISKFYKKNRNSLLKYLFNVHQGIGFYSKKVESGNVEISKFSKMNLVEIGKYPFSKGEFFKILEPGHYQFKVSAKGFNRTIEADVLVDQIISNGNYYNLDEIKELGSIGK